MFTIRIYTCFANSSNIQWYAGRKPCAGAAFTATIKKDGEACITELRTTANSISLQWQVYDAQRFYNYSNVKLVQLPEHISPNAIVTLKVGAGCVVTRRMADDPAYLAQKVACATGAAIVEPSAKVLLYPNPGTGLFKCMQNGQPVIAEEVSIHNVSGFKLANFANTQQFSIAALPPGMYFYTLLINKIAYKGKLVKI